MNIKDINPDAYRVVDQPLNINNLPQGSYSTVSQLETPKPSFLQKAGSVLDMIFGGGKVGEAIGTEIAKAMASPEERKQPALTEGAPTAGEIAGSALQSAALFTPVGRIAGVIGKGLGKVGITTGAKFLSNVGAGAVAGEAFDVAGNLQKGKTGVEALKPGFGTAVGAGLPLVPPILKGARVLARESVGISTGAGGGAITELFKASAKGGEAKKAAVAALRGNTTPEQIVQEARGALGQIKNSRATEYVRSLNTLKESTKSYDISPIVESVKTNLQKFGVTLGQDGALDFSRSPIRFNTEAQKDITTIIETMADFGSRKGDRTVVGIDSLKRAFDDLYTPSGQARAFVQSVKDSARKILSEVPGYDAMSLNYETKSKLINEVQKALSLGDKASIDTSFKKLTTILRTNNEERKILAEELNAISGGTLIPTIAGQQMSEILPRGIARQIEGFGALGSILAGFGAPLLKMALFASPRVVGEFVNAIGIGAQAGNKLLDILGVKGVKLISPGDRILKAIQGKPAIASNTQTVKSATKVNTTKSIAVNPTTIPPELQPLAREAQKYSSAEEFVKEMKSEPVVGVEFHGSDTKFTSIKDQPMFLAPHEGYAKTYGENVTAFVPKAGKTLDLRKADVAKPILTKLFGSPERKALFDKVPEHYLLKGEYDRYPRDNFNSFDDWLWEKFPESEQKAIRAKYQDAYLAYGNPSKEVIYNKWEDIIKYAKSQGYDYIKHTGEDAGKTSTFTETVALNPKKTLQSLTDFYNKVKGIKK